MACGPFPRRVARCLSSEGLAKEDARTSFGSDHGPDARCGPTFLKSQYGIMQLEARLRAMAGEIARQRASYTGTPIG
jgi:hypothetical protein